MDIVCYKVPTWLDLFLRLKNVRVLLTCQLVGHVLRQEADEEAWIESFLEPRGILILCVYCVRGILQVMEAKARYSALVEDLETVCSFLDIQHKRGEHNITQYPMIDFLVSGHLAQSESTNPNNCNVLEAENGIPLVWKGFKYIRTCIADW